MTNITKISHLALISAMLCSEHSVAAISIHDTGSINDQIETGGATLANLSLSTSINTAVFLFYSSDTAGTVEATFAGQEMTVLRDAGNSRGVLAYLANPTNLIGNLDVNASSSGGGLELAYWGVASGVDTSAIQTSSGSILNVNQQLISSFGSLNSSDVVYSLFAINSHNDTAAYSGGLAIQDGALNHHDAIVTTDTITSSGVFTPTVGFVPNLNSNSPEGVSIAFTAAPIPEPSTSILTLLGSMILLLGRRK